jgi:hypothetical protein
VAYPWDLNGITRLQYQHPAYRVYINVRSFIEAQLKHFFTGADIFKMMVPFGG